MGTRAIATVENEHGETLVTIYRQFDGYPEGFGAELRDFLAGKKILNGFSGQTLAAAFNGAGCLAAALVAHLKTQIGNVYLYPAGAKDCGEEFTYKITAAPGKPVRLTVTDVYANPKVVVYDGPVDEYTPKA